MKLRLAKLLVCPVDRQGLEVLAFSSRQAVAPPAELCRSLGCEPADFETEIVTGLLLNPRLKLAYPIFNGVPRMLVFQTGLHQTFAREHGAQMQAEAPSYRFADYPSAPGEQDVLRSFSNEWVDYDWKGDSYWNLSAEAWFKAMRLAIGVEQQPLKGKRVLEVGIGIGAFADHLASTEGCELIGMDLGYAVDSAARHFQANPQLHIVQASAFAPPFRESSFDFVYSFGVLHHTYSTKAAFDQVSRLPVRGGRFYLMVYSPWDESRTAIRRALMLLEKLVRPWMSRLPNAAQSAALVPLVPAYMAYQLARVLRRVGPQIRYGWREAVHAARDRFTPRYIHRHSDEEVEYWFKAAGYDQLSRNSALERPNWVPEGFTTHADVAGIRKS